MADTAQQGFLEGLLAGVATGAPGGWLGELRARALERANALPVPTTRDEDWRFTDLAPLYRSVLRAPAAADDFDAGALAPWVVPEAALRCVFVDGRFRADLSAVGDGGGVEMRFGTADAAGVDWIREHLGRLAAFDHDTFVAANTARAADALLLRVPRGVSPGAPIHCLFLNTQPGTVTHPRVLVVAEPGSQVMLAEDFVGIGAGGYCVNGVGEFWVGENAEVRHVRLQRDSRTAFHMGTTAVRVARDGRYLANAVSMGARLSRHNWNVEQAGEGTHFELDGLAMIDGRQLSDTHSFVDHATPNGTSRQIHKCVVAGGAHAVFNGRILVRPGAQQTNSAQESRNLLLSEKAQVDTKPQLEIFADDVKCAHGAAVGQLDPEEVFYLRSRGMADDLARRLLTYGFAADIVDRIPIPSVVAALRGAILQQTGIEELA